MTRAGSPASFSNSLRLVKDLKFAGIRVVFVAQGIDTMSEHADLLVATYRIVDELYIKDLAKRTFRGVKQLALKGLHTGYRRVPIESGAIATAGRSSKACGSKLIRGSSDGAQNFRVLRGWPLLETHRARLEPRGNNRRVVIWGRTRKMRSHESGKRI